MNKHKFPYNWKLSDKYPSSDIYPHDETVFGTFICGGGSTMGYKLAGYKHLGGVEIDPKIATVYKTNHSPQYLFVEDIRAFNKRKDLPGELYNLSILDGSPPCSSFSIAGNGDKDWGKEKRFAEGQELQRLDDLVFEYIETISMLKPRVAVLENVKGLIQGNAKAYAKEIKLRFEKAGYRVQLFLLNAASMGVPQRRERLFFIGLRNDFSLPPLKLNFAERGITVGEFAVKVPHTRTKSEKRFGDKVLNKNEVCPTLTTKIDLFYDKQSIDLASYCKIGSYPTDYNFGNVRPISLIGMSVPPVVAAQISHQIYLQWLSKI